MIKTMEDFKQGSVTTSTRYYTTYTLEGTEYRVLINNGYEVQREIEGIWVTLGNTGTLELGKQKCLDIVNEVKAPKVKRTRKPKVELKWTKENIKALLEKNDIMVERSVVELYKKQTDDEKATQSANHNNCVGFNGVDSGILSSFAKQILNKRKLSVVQLEIARNKMGKYACQLAKIANILEEEKGKV